MAIEKVYVCDLCGEPVQRAELAVARVGTPDDRPEDAERIDVGPECHARPIGDLLTVFGKIRNG
jgi:hypothetical protein